MAKRTTFLFSESTSWMATGKVRMETEKCIFGTVNCCQVKRGLTFKILTENEVGVSFGYGVANVHIPKLCRQMQRSVSL
ncbi:hypothetical protein VIGAN_01528100 [Vigna angularis var. angularis]|uniref:Uncharacterized protein n=1 Tax=Vigna angularis var. angularis TaxID=157739 RepID=A0A0S3R9B6_PHAAN|nr:hypothetical protein VIGAN_01528100 [Vigna angularis var. angularis]